MGNMINNLKNKYDMNYFIKNQHNFDKMRQKMDTLQSNVVLPSIGGVGPMAAMQQQRVGGGG